MKIITHSHPDSPETARLRRLLPILAPAKMPTPMEEQLHQYKLISNGDIFLVLNTNNQPLDKDLSLQILCAMILQKPVIIPKVPIFDAAVPIFIKELILSKLSKFLLCDLTLLDDNDTKSFIDGIQGKQNYVLTRHEVVLSKAQIRSFFRDSLQFPNVIS